MGVTEEPGAGGELAAGGSWRRFLQEAGSTEHCSGLCLGPMPPHRTLCRALLTRWPSWLQEVFGPTACKDGILGKWTAVLWGGAACSAGSRLGLAQ